MEKVLKLDSEYLAQTYKRLPVAFSRGRGIFLWDLGGKKYLDFIAGVSVSVLGHAHPELVREVSNQMKRLIHIPNTVYIREQAELAKLLAGITPGRIGKFFFVSSGAEAVETAFKISIKHTRRRKILAMEGSFHGRTAGALAATWKPSYRRPFKPLLPGVFEFVPFNDLDAAERVIGEGTAAVVVEPVQGEGGIRVVSGEFLRGLRELCDERGALLVCDEIQCGMGRTGRWFACEHWDVEPDVITVAKGLGGGVPIGCAGAKPEVMDSLSTGDHGATFGGNPLACVAAKTVVRIMKREGLVRRAERMGAYFRRALEEVAEDHDCVREVRGLGLMLGMEVSSEKLAERAVLEVLKKGFLINSTAERVLRFLPPLVVERIHIDRLIEALDEVLKRMEHEGIG